MIFFQSIRNFLHEPGMEGPQQLKGYIPCNLRSGGTANYRGGPNPANYDPMGISGVTIGTGVDLGQTDAETLASIGVDDATINLFRPYLGKRKDAAVQALHGNTLAISPAAADQLDEAMLNHHIHKIARYYDKATHKGAFETLPAQAQCVIVSIQYQRGVNSPRKYPNTWKAFCERDWADASARLCNASLWDGYHARRRKEGMLLKEIA